MSTDRIYDTIIIREPITKGWSGDKKYCITTADGTRYLLRISPPSQYETKKNLFSLMEQMAALDIPMCLPIEFGVCEEGVYSIQSWIEGKDLDTVLPLTSNTMLSEDEQYSLGLQVGKIAKRIHTIPITEPQETWNVRCNQRIDEKILEYKSCGLSFHGDNLMLDYIEKSRHLLINRPQSFMVGDYNVMNMMYQDGDLIIIDFERFEMGDPWDEFNCIVWNAMASPYFATGQLHGYFGGEPPMEFFKLLPVYIIILLLSLLTSWAITSDYGREVTLKMSQHVLKWYDNMQNPIPTWYKKELLKPV